MIGRRQFLAGALAAGVAVPLLGSLPMEEPENPFAGIDRTVYPTRLLGLEAPQLTVEMLESAWLA